MGESWWLPRNRMRETFTSGSVGRAPGNRCLYPEGVGVRCRQRATSLTIQVNRWSQAAAILLPPQQEVMGWVHSCYARIINVHTPGGRLLTLQGEGMLQAPLGLALATDVAALGT